MQYAKYSKQTNVKPIPANTLQNAQPTKPNQQTPKPTPIFYTPSQQKQQQQQHNITLGCVGSRCRWFINRPPPTHHTNLDAIYRWRTTRTRMSKRSCWARRACAPVSRAKIWSLGKYCKINELVDHSAIKQPNRTTNQIQQWKTKLSICSYQTNQKKKWKPKWQKSLEVIYIKYQTRLARSLSCSHSSMAYARFHYLCTVLFYLSMYNLWLLCVVRACASVCVRVCVCMCMTVYA